MAPVDLLVILSLRLLLVAAIVGGEEWNDKEECVDPLGMESGKISPSQITASSSFDPKNTGPQNARLRQEIHAGAWCPQPVIKDGIKEFLEIDLKADYRITQTETQGRFGNGVGQEYTESFQLEYWRHSLYTWIPYQDHLGRTILEANTNTYIGVKQSLVPPIIASRIRFIPYSVHPRTICMRVEAYGCLYTEGVIHYECPQGYWKKNPDVDLRDSSYDGRMDENGNLRGGLGLLVDSLHGPNDFRAPHKNKGNMWIGWDNQSDPVKISFQFDQMRKFRHVSIHVNNFVSQGAQVFASVAIYFSVYGQKFSEVPLRYVPKEDLKNETAHLVQIPLKGRLATHIRLDFNHSNHWLLLSEISFHSDIFTGNISDEIHSLNYLQDGPEENSSRNKLNKVMSGTSSTTSSGAMIGLIAGSLSVFVLLSIVTLVCYVMRRNRRNSKLVGVMGMGMTPKSMSIGLGLGCGGGGGPSASDHSDTTSTKTFGNTSCTSINSKEKLSTTTSTKKSSSTNKKSAKIALCDLKPVSISGEIDSDESLYHELVFGLAHNARGGGLSAKERSSTSIGHGHTLAHAISSSTKNASGSVGSNSSESAGSSVNSHTSGRKTTTNNKKNKYQRVNHGGDFSDFMGVRSIHDEMNFFSHHHSNHNHHHNQQQQQQQSSPSTPSSGVRGLTSHGLPTATSQHTLLVNSHNLSSMPSVLPPPPPPAFRHPLHFNSNGNGNNCNSPIVFTTTSSNKPNLSGGQTGATTFFNSPHGRQRGNLSATNNSNNINNSNGNVSAGITSNGIGNLSHSHGNLHGTNVTGIGNGGPNPLIKLQLQGVGGQSNYYAATDIFHVTDKHFERF